MTRRGRVLLLAGVAVLVGVAAATAVYASSRGSSDAPVAQAMRPLHGSPPLALDLPPAAARREAAELRRARAGDRAALADLRRIARLARDPAAPAVASIIARYRELGPSEALRELHRLPQRSPVVSFHLGLVEAWSGDLVAAARAWRRTLAADRYGFYGGRADNLLHPDELPGSPFYLPAQSPRPASVRALRRETARHPGRAQGWLELATVLQASDRARAIAAARRAVTLDPTGVEPRVALAVLAFDKDRPAQSLQALQTLASQAPQNAEIAFHLALAELWLRQVEDARAGFRQVLDDGDGGRYATAARTFLAKLPKP